MRVFANFTGAWCAKSVTSCLASDINNTACKFNSFKTIFCSLCHKKMMK